MGCRCAEENPNQTPNPPTNKTTRRRGLRKETSCKIASVEKLGKCPFRITVAALPGAKEPRGLAPRLTAREKPAGPAPGGNASPCPRRSPPASPGSHAKMERDRGKATEPRTARRVRQAEDPSAHRHPPPRGPPRPAPRKAPASLRVTAAGRGDGGKWWHGPPRGPVALPPPEVCFPAVLHQSLLCY